MRRGEQIPSVSPDYSGRIVLAIKNGQLISEWMLNENEFIGSLDAFLALAEKAGYRVTAPEDLTDVSPEVNHA